jgi:hypothetical protein
MDSISLGRVWTGRVLSGLAAAFLFIDALGKLMKLPRVVEGLILRNPRLVALLWQGAR